MLYELRFSLDELCTIMHALQQDGRLYYERSKEAEARGDIETARKWRCFVIDDMNLYRRLLNAEPISLDAMEKDYHDRYDTTNQSQ